MNNFKVIIVEDVPLELKGTEGIFRNDIPEAQIIGTAENEVDYWKLIKKEFSTLVWEVQQQLELKSAVTQRRDIQI